MKKVTKKYMLALLGCVTVLILGILGYSNVNAATEDFYFKYNNVKYKDGDTIELKSAAGEIWVSSDEGLKLEGQDKITWTFFGKEVIGLKEDSTNPLKADITRIGPGYADITALIVRNGVTYNIQCKLKVGFDVEKTNFTEVLLTGEKALLYKEVDNAAENPKTVTLKYTNDNGPSQIIDNKNPSLTWTTLDDKVATVVDGVVTAVGAGKTQIKITTNSVSKEVDPLEEYFDVIVSPQAIKPGDDPVTGDYISFFKVISNNKTQITTNAKDTSKLLWKFYSSDGKTEIAPAGKIDYSVFNDSTFTINSAKAGSYYIRAFVDSKYLPSNFNLGNPSSSVPYLEIEFDVPVKFFDDSFVMGVGDTYNIIDNSNIASASQYNFASDKSGVATVNSSGVITGVSKGTTTITVTKIGDGTSHTITVTVIDGIALNAASINLYTSGTYQLEALTTDRKTEVKWTSSNPSVATVDNTDKKGLVTGVSKGTAVITATQIINGVVKTASCTVYVQDSVNEITLDPSEVVLNIKDYKTIKAKIAPDGLNNVKLKWTTSNENVVKITDAGNLTATIQGVAGGTAVITAINQENVVVGYCTVTVKEKVTGITLSASQLSLTLSDRNYQLRAIVTPDKATNKTVNWKSTNSSVATVDSNGLVTLVSSGTVSIIATLEDDPTVTAYCNITVGTSVSSIKLDDSKKTMYVGDSTRLSYLLTPTNASNKGVIWTSTDTSVASIDSTGLLKANAAGVAIIILKTSDGAYMSTCTITVVQKATGITFDVTNLELYIDQTHQIKVSVTPSNSTDYSLTWESSDSAIATVDSEGKVTGKATGKTIIIAKTSLGSIVYCNVTVKAKPTGLQLNYTEKTIVTGESFHLKASIIPSSASQEVTYTYTSSKTGVATVAANGTVKGLKGGTSIITVKTSDGKYSELCVVTVVERVTSIKLNKTSYKLGVGKSFTITATVKTNAATNPKIKWTSSNTKIATVDANGRVTGRALGTVTITAAAQDGSLVKATASVRVVKAVSSITLNKTSVTTIVGRTFKLKATVRPSKATYKTVNWTSSDENIAIVDSDGVVTALKAGNVTIKATAKDSSGKYATAYIIVQPRVPSNSVTIINQNLTMVVGETNTLQKAINPTNSTDGFTWESDNRTVATVNSSTGRVTARTPGIANVTVMTESGKTATTKVTVVGLNTTYLELEQYSSYRLSVIGITNGVTWDVADNTIAVVTNGQVSSRRLGTTTITATVNGRKLTCTLKVVKIK